MAEKDGKIGELTAAEKRRTIRDAVREAATKAKVAPEALDDALCDRIKQQIRANTTPRHVPAKILQVADIPRTISGKITEIAVRDTIHGKPVKNTDALANPQALECFRDLPELALA